MPVIAYLIFITCIYVFFYYMVPAIQFEKPENEHGGVLLLKLATLLKVTLLQGCFSPFLNISNGTKSRKASHLSFTIIHW